jgi:small subunit ribosomal protein S4
MTKIISAKHKIDRRLAVNLWGRPKSPLNTRSYGPGQHGQRKGKPSDYGIQLMAKQKLKGYYGRVGERQFRNLFDEAVRRKGDTSENLIDLLERRLDATVYRAKLANTIFGARQLVSHGHVLVNGQRVNIPSYSLKDGDVLTLREKSRQLTVIIESLASAERDIPDYLEVNPSIPSVKFIRAPKLAEVPYPVQMEPNLVTEFYSR